MKETSFFDEESKFLFKEIPISNLSKIKLSFSLDFDIGQSYVTSKIVDRDNITRKMNIQAGQKGIKLQKDLCRLKSTDKVSLPSHVYIKTMLKDSQILIRKLPVIGTSEWLLIFEEDLFVLAVKGLYDEIELLG
ncbi:MAG TPA: hypothetical protein VN703_07700 [Candidatus Sulfopaludibacter sp.]|jgi:hypothetical protein|nr:hypothetical protein [Candidatus Sulfopaludibacter sp.]